jgi:hypothetical protein
VPNDLFIGEGQGRRMPDRDPASGERGTAWPGQQVAEAPCRPRWAAISSGAMETHPVVAVPFAFLETGYLFFYTVFARRHAEYLERAINQRFGRDVLVAHRLEAAYFYPPEAPKIAAISLGRPLGMMSVMTLGYTIGAGLLWLAGMGGLVDLAARDGGSRFAVLGFPIGPFLAPVALALTVLIAGYLCWKFLTGHDERRLLAELDATCGPAPAAGAA